MPAEPQRRERQMTLWESDGCIVPLKLEDQSSGTKPGNTGVGKAARLVLTHIYRFSLSLLATNT